MVGSRRPKRAEPFEVRKEDIDKLLQVGEVPISELHRLLELHKRQRLHRNPYVTSGVHDQHVVYYAEPVEVVGLRQQQGLKPDSFRCVKSKGDSMEFDVAQFNNELLKRAQRAFTRQRQCGIIQIGEPDEQAAKAILAKTEEKLKAVGRQDKPTILDALLAASMEARFVEDAVIENLTVIGYIELDYFGEHTRVSYKGHYKNVSEYVTRLLMQHNASVSEFCTAPERQWDMTTNSFTADVRNLLREMNVEDGSDLEKVKLDSLVVIDRLERMVESRPKTLKALRTVITPVARTIVITPLNVTFAKLTGNTPQLKTIKFQFNEASIFPFSLTTEKIFIAEERAVKSRVSVKEAKKFYRNVFCHFRKAKKGDKFVQYRFASAEMKGESVKKLQEWLKNSGSNCGSSLQTGDESDGVLHYTFAGLDVAAGLPPLSRPEIYSVLAKLATTTVVLTADDVVRRLQELQVLKKHPDKTVFFVNKIRKLIGEVYDANKMIKEYVSLSAKRYRRKVAASH
ncbi:hypothetical protein NP493_756g00003 [Ridgeia piscesae]|uniref:Uncharacterized protein n=1 Tax=Ridgeia piscesae TaxID=27915 RepID=A0AAD9KPN9_RIDPI|nr:hypothetical protein NP493_756g00003 [Ridgeia piscesae]